MHIPLDQFEHYFEESILRGGIAAFTKGAVIHFESPAYQVMEAVVADRREYYVKLVLEEDNVVEYTCSCGAHSGLCKHMAAVFVFMQQGELGIQSTFTKNSVKKLSAENKGGRVQMEELLEDVPDVYMKSFILRYTTRQHDFFERMSKAVLALGLDTWLSEKRPAMEEMDQAGRAWCLMNKVLEELGEWKKIVLHYAMKNRGFRDLMMATFLKYNRCESKWMYLRRLSSSVKHAVKSYGMVHAYDLYEVDATMKRLIFSAQEQMDSENYYSAMNVSLAVVMATQEVLYGLTDYSGLLQENYEAGYKLLNRLAEKVAYEGVGDVMKALFWKECEILMRFVVHGKTVDINSFLLAMLVMDNAGDEYLVKQNLDNVSEHHKLYREVQVVRYDFIHRVRGEEEAGEYVKKHLSNSFFHEMMLKRALEAKDFSRASALALEGINKFRGQVSDGVYLWYRYLLKIALKKNRRSDIIQWARYLLIHDSKTNRYAYQVLKERMTGEQWALFLWKMEKELEGYENDILGCIYVWEQRLDSLMAYVKKDPELQRVEYYARYLAQGYGYEITLLYGNAVLEWTISIKDSRYDELVMEKLKKVKNLGCEPAFRQVLADFRRHFSRRWTFLAALDKL